MPPQAVTRPGNTARAQESQNHGRRIGRGRTGWVSSQSAAARGGTTGPRQSPSRATSRTVASPIAAMPLGIAASRSPPWPV